MAKKIDEEDVLTTTTGRPSTAEAPTTPRRVHIRSLRPSFYRNGKRFTQEGETFDADELNWSEEQWRRARADRMLVIEQAE